MAIKTYDDTNFIMIASAIRAKSGLSTQYKPSEMAAAINALKMARDVEPNNSASGLKVKFEDGADGEKYNSLVLNIPLLQDGTGDPSPTNKRAFVSYTKFEVYYSGADTSDYETYSLNHSILGGTLDLISGAEHFFSTSLMLVNYSDNLTIYTDTDTGVSLFYLPWSTSFGDIYSESFKTVEKQASLSEAAANMPNNSIAGAKDAAVGTIGFFIRADSFSTVSELIASVGLDKCYSTELMDDTTITSGLFTNVTELGVNNLWAIGYRQAVPYLNQDIPLEVSYKADPTLYANNLVYETVRDLLPQDTASGAIANFPDGSDNYPVVELKANIDPIQEGSGDPSPSNVRPISGRSSCKVTRIGKNLYNADNEELNCYLDSSGTLRTNSAGWKTSDYIPIKGGGEYTFNPNSTSGTTAKHCYFDTNKNFISAINSGAITFTAPQNASYMRFSLRDSSSDVQLEVGSTATSYEAYSGVEKTINFGQTILGGVLNVTTGVLTIDRAIVDLSTFTDWTYQSTNSRFVSSSLANIIKKPASNSVLVDGVYCSLYKVEISNNISSSSYDNIIAISSNGNIQIRDTSLNGDLTALATALANSQFVYVLATPYEIQLTPEEVRTLLGVNNIYADSGDVEVTYRADIALYIDKIINS